MSEGQTLATAGQNVLRHYPVETSQKAIDWIALFGAIGMVYGTRIGTYALRKRMESLEQHKPQATVYQMPVAPRAAPSQQAAPQPAPEPPSHVQVEFEHAED